MKPATASVVLLILLELFYYPLVSAFAVQDSLNWPRQMAMGSAEYVHVPTAAL
jgi:hypothetical protein